MNEREARMENMRARVLCAAAELFLKLGYQKSTTRGIARHANVQVSAMNRIFGCKENILSELAVYVVQAQFEAMAAAIPGVEADPLRFYAAETTMQLYMAESSESVRELYLAAYSLAGPMQVIQDMLTRRLEQMFRDHLPNLTDQDFYELELASGGIIRSFMAHPCDETFTMRRKVRCFLESSLRVYRASEEQIARAIAFVERFDFHEIARCTIERMLAHLRENNGGMSACTPSFT